MQKQLPKSIVDLAQEAELVQPTRFQELATRPAEHDTATYAVNAAVVPPQSGGQQAAPAVSQSAKPGLTAEQVSSLSSDI